MGAVSLLFAAVLCLPLSEVSAADQAARLTADIEFLTSKGSRAVGYPGAAAAAGLIEGRFRDLGLTDVRRREYTVGMPMDRGASLTVGETGLSVQLLCMWPNLVRTSTLPPEGLHLPLVYAGSGEWAELNGNELEGRAVLMEFNSGLNWLRPASLGAVAVLFIEPEETTAREAKRKYAVAPIDVPRFWIDARSGKQLRRRLEDEGELAVTLRGRMDWEMRPAWNLTALLPGSDPELAGETVVLQAYYDAASVVPALAPGATAACGTAALLETARHLVEQRPGRSVLFLATSAHYQAQQGIVDFVNRSARTHEEYSARFGEPLDIALFVGSTSQAAAISSVSGTTWPATSCAASSFPTPASSWPTGKRLREGRAGIRSAPSSTASARSAAGAGNPLLRGESTPTPDGLTQPECPPSPWPR